MHRPRACRRHYWECTGYGGWSYSVKAEAKKRKEEQQARKLAAAVCLEEWILIRGQNISLPSSCLKPSLPLLNSPPYKGKSWCFSSSCSVTLHLDCTSENFAYLLEVMRRCLYRMFYCILNKPCWSHIYKCWLTHYYENTIWFLIETSVIKSRFFLG